MFDKVRPKGKKQLVKAAQNLMNNSRPSKIAVQLGNLLTQIDLQRAQFPHQLVQDTKAGKPFIQTDFNKDGLSYRSPYTNRYYPERDEAYYPTPPLREIQQKGNILFDEYTRLYYGKQHQVIFMQCKNNNFQVLYMFAIISLMKTIKKDVGTQPTLLKLQETLPKALIIKFKQQWYELFWFPKKERNYHKTQKVESKKLTPQYQMEEFHLIAIGKMVEDMQTYMTQQIQRIYLAKTKDIIFKTRIKQNKEYEERKKKLAKELMELRPRDTR